jgi:hypothetical protein
VGSDATARVWAATWVPAPAPLPGYGADGYAVAWVDHVDGERIQVLVDGAQPEPGTPGRLVEREVEGSTITLFVRSDP